MAHFGSTKDEEGIAGGIELFKKQQKKKAELKELLRRYENVYGDGAAKVLMNKIMRKIDEL